VSRTVILLPDAVADVAEGHHYYERKQPGLGEQFLVELDCAYGLIAADPLHYPLRFDSFRRMLVRRFPYAVYFDYDDTAIYVHYVFQCAQDPEKLAQRLRKT
jgi:hypothetical protein